MRSSGRTAVVVGSGPNGLAAAVTLARAGVAVRVLEAEPTVGGGARTLPDAFSEAVAPGMVHDVCSAVHPMGLASPFMRAFDLRSRGVDLIVPDVSYAQPLDGGDAGIAWRDIGRTADFLGDDRDAWLGLLGPLAADPDTVVSLGLGDKRSLPRRVLRPRGALTAARMGLAIGTQGTPLWSRPLRTERARALLTGVAAHAITPLPSLAAAGTAVLLATLAHAGGWAIPRGGSRAIADALIADLLAHGGSIETDRPVLSRSDLPAADVVLLDVSADDAARIVGRAAPPVVRRGLRTLGHRGAAAKVDFVVNGPIPWAHPHVGRASTVHIGGTRTQMAAAERDVLRGRLPAAPVVLASDPTVADPTREVDGLRPVWAYAHVPLGCEADPVPLVTAQIERFAPGFRDTVVAARGIPASRMSGHDRAIVGGDIAMGTVDIARMVARPSAAWDPFRLDEATFLCSAAAVPGPGVHGMAGYYAARRALTTVFADPRPPSLAPDQSRSA